MEILYNLRLGSELNCKYGPDLETKHVFQVKEEKSITKYKEEEKTKQNKKENNKSPAGFSGVKFLNFVN